MKLVDKVEAATPGIDISKEGNLDGRTSREKGEKKRKILGNVWKLYPFADQISCRMMETSFI